MLMSCQSNQSTAEKKKKPNPINMIPTIFIFIPIENITPFLEPNKFSFPVLKYVVFGFRHCA